MLLVCKALPPLTFVRAWHRHSNEKIPIYICMHVFQHIYVFFGHSLGSSASASESVAKELQVATMFTGAGKKRAAANAKGNIDLPLKARRTKAADLPDACVGCDCLPDRNGKWGNVAPLTQLPVGPLCEPCGQFSDASGLSASEINQIRTGKDKSKGVSLQASISEARSSIEDPSTRTFNPGEIYELVISGSRIESVCEFQDRASFKEEHGMFPEDAKLTQIRTSGIDGGDVVGIAKNEGDVKLVRYTDAQVIQLKPLHSKADHIFTGQHDQLMDALIKERCKLLGQRDGNKYQLKKNVQRCTRLSRSVTLSAKPMVHVTKSIHCLLFCFLQAQVPLRLRLDPRRTSWSFATSLPTLMPRLQLHPVMIARRR
jgi:hypothetical protein